MTTVPAVTTLDHLSGIAADADGAPSEPWRLLARFDPIDDRVDAERAGLTGRHETAEGLGVTAPAGVAVVVTPRVIRRFRPGPRLRPSRAPGTPPGRGPRAGAYPAAHENFP